MTPRVLIVDDEPDILELAEFKLSAEGFQVLKALSGLEGLRRARCEAPDVIVLDLMLPDLDGYAVCEILRAQPSTREVPVIIFSVLDQPFTRSRKLRANVFQWLKKDGDFAPLSQGVRAALERHSETVRRRVHTEER